jgi:citrate lyase synthetase
MEENTDRLLNIFPTRNELENFKIIATRRIDELEEHIKILENKINEHEKQRKEYKQTRKSGSE